MNLSRANLILLVAAVALAVPTWLQLQRDGGAFTDVADIPLMFDGFTSDNVGSVLLAQPKAEQPQPDPTKVGQKPPVAYDQLLLLRTDAGFQVAAPQGDLVGAPVSKDKVQADVFLHLGRIRSDKQTMVQPAATPEQLERYGLDEPHAFVIQVKDLANKNAVAELLIGKNSDEGQTGTEAIRGVYVRKGGTTDVVLYEFEQDTKMWRRDVQPAGWVDKLLFRLEPTAVTYLSIRNTAGGAKPFVFVKKDGKASWVADPKPEGAGYENLGAVRQTEVESVVQRLRYVAAQDFRLPMARAGNLTALGLGPAQIELQARWKEGDVEREVTLEIGNKLDGKNEYYLSCSLSQFLMTWPASLIAPLERDPREFFDPAAAPVEQKEDKDGKDGK
ncbi:MAG: DUF4340 domain-containing protein [Planctomycetes bacterium]|nr:DUF4340 domain-containing protein [Planctomycetota bacterium]MCB9884828.1 DUF4340 domain-containing protein [Planctomycetota bacterium]